MPTSTARNTRSARGGGEHQAGRLGGITPTVAMRNAAQDLGMHFCIEDCWGGDVTAAAGLRRPAPIPST